MIGKKSNAARTAEREDWKREERVLAHSRSVHVVAALVADKAI